MTLVTSGLGLGSSKGLGIEGDFDWLLMGLGIEGDFDSLLMHFFWHGWRLKTKANGP